MQHTRQRCLDGGYLVDGRHEVPEDLTECYGDANARLVGCNRLRCLRCGEMVQHEVAGTVRRYLCGCAGWLECATRPTSMLCTEGQFDDAGMPWRCAGHPSVTRPVSLSELPNLIIE